jgi:hypothetical protein
MTHHSTVALPGNPDMSHYITIGICNCRKHKQSFKSNSKWNMMQIMLAITGSPLLPKFDNSVRGLRNMTS